jgi:hypothetical protein
MIFIMSRLRMEIINYFLKKMIKFQKEPTRLIPKHSNYIKLFFSHINLIYRYTHDISTADD